jgi:hypothetical protein
MPLKKLPYDGLTQLLEKHLSTDEDEDAQRLIDDMTGAHRRGFLTKPELVRICRWKSARAIHQIRRNGVQSIRRITRDAFRARSERKKLELLTSLHGVSVPMASAILTMTNPKRYGVIDIRVWQLLFKIGAVARNERGAGFDFRHWYSFLVLIRYHAKENQVRARDIERTLFNVHSLYQKGRLYGR